jgi:hypothetical protein
LRISTVLVLGVSVLFIGNLIQIGIWAAVFMYYDEFTAFKDAFYHSSVNFTTLCYGDFILGNERKLLGGLEAVNGGTYVRAVFRFSIHAPNLIIAKKTWDKKLNQTK